MIAEPAVPAVLDCPRCGYDQSGIAATWETACDLEGVCPECGLDFHWRDLFALRILDEEGKFEFAERRRARALITTWTASFAPWRFWSWLRLAEPPRPRRLTSYGLLVLALSYGVAGIASLIAWAVGPYSAVELSPGFALKDISTHHGHGAACDVWLVGVPVVSEWRNDSWQWRLLLLLWLGLLPLTYPLVAATLAKTKVRSTHLWRIGVYTMGTVPLVLAAFFVFASLAYTATWLYEYVRGSPPAYRLSHYVAPGEPFRGVDVLIRHRWSFATAVMGVWLILCQGFALKRYLKIPQAWFVACVLTFVAALAAFTCVLLVFGPTWLVHRLVGS